MAQYYNVVTNPNGTFNIQLEDIQLIDGQNVLLVEDINNGANLISQQIVTYASAPDNTEQTLFSQPTINLGAHVTTAQLETRPSVYIIKTNDPPIQQTIFNKSNSGNSKLQDDSNSKGSKDQMNVCYTQPFSTRENNESFELVIKEDPTPVKNIVTNTVRNQQPVVTTQCSTPNVLIQGNAEKKITRLIPINKRPSVGTPTIGILKSTVQGSNSQPAKVGKMKRNSNLTNPPNITLPTRSRASTGGVSTTNQLATPRTPQARPPIHSDASQKNSLPLSKNPTNPQFPEMGQLSERIRQATLKQRQQQNEQRQKQQQPVMAVTPMQRTAQSTQAPVQRQRIMGQLLTLNRQQLQLQQQQQQQLQLQQQQQQLQQQHMLQRQQVPAVIPVSQQSRQVQVSTMTENAEPMEVDSSENVQSERLNQINCTAKNEMEENSSESFAYLQQEIDDPHTAIVQHQIQGNEAKMLVILENGEQRLITFEVPKEDCTVQDLLEQANIFSSQEPHVSLVSDPALGINYIVDVTAKSSIHEEDHGETSPSSEGSSVATISEPKTPVKNTNPPAMPHVPISPRVPKYVSGMLAVCSFCGMSAADFNYCMRCKRKLPENVKAISISTGSATKKEAIAPDTFYKKTEPSLPHKPDRETISKRGRGRGRTTTRTRQVKEPECLTISSDEEDDNRKQKRLGDGKEIVNSQNSATEEAETILEKEPVITNNSVSPMIVHLPNSQYPLSGGRELGTQGVPTSNLNTFLTCRTVRIGSYKYVPNDKIILSTDGLKLDVPLLEDDKSSVIVDIKFCDLVKVLIHFTKSMPVLFFYTNVATGKSIREILGMQDPKGPYFDPAGKDHTHKRITLLPERIPDDSKTILKELYKPIFEELNTKEANDILVRASPKTKAQVQTPVKKPTPTGSSSSSSTSTNSNGVIQTITVYPPPPAKGGIAINTEDYICLAEDQFLNDVIIDFYLKYLTLEKLSEDDHNRTHVFSSYFYKRLTSPHAQAVENPDKLSPEAKRHARVQKWTKNVNIFEKDFIVIPINEHAHWFLAIVCFPGLVGTVTPKVEVKTENQKLPDKKKKDSKSLTIGNTTITPVSTITIDTNDDGSERDEAEGDDEEMETDSDDDDDESDSTPNSEEVKKENCQTSETKEVIKVPCILIFDSLAGASRSRVVATLRDYLSCEYKAKMGAEKVFSKDTIKGACPKVPQQSNFTDCGLYVLQYVESFFENPLMDYTLPIKTLKTWFEEIIVTRKREEIAKLLIQLVENTKGNKTITLPNLTFPTQDGKLKQKPDQTETRAAKLEAEVKRKAAEAAESKLNAATSTTEKVESSNESSSKVGTSQTTIPQSVNQITCTTDGNIIIQKEATTSTNARSPAETMAFLKTKRIPRLQKSSDNQDDKQVAKKHKGESFDSCK